MREKQKEKYHKKIIVKDSFLDDFNCRRIKRALTQTYAEGKDDKAAAIKKAGGSKIRDEKIAKDAKALLWSILGEQWCLLLIGMPFMLAGSLIDFLAPNFIGKIFNEFRADNFEGEDGVYDILKIWVIVLAISSTCALIREFIFGVASQRIGYQIRLRLFDAVIHKDVNFYDNIRTGDVLSRLGSDTQIV